MKIGDLAKKCGIPVETIRYYEKEGLLPTPNRTDNNYRIYSKIHEERLIFIRHCRSLDMSLDEIHLLLDYRDLPDANCARINALLDTHIGHVTERINELKKLETQLKALRSRCIKAVPVDHCGILNALSCPVFCTEISSHTECNHIPHSHTKKANNVL